MLKEDVCTVGLTAAYYAEQATCWCGLTHTLITLVSKFAVGVVTAVQMFYMQEEPVQTAVLPTTLASCQLTSQSCLESAPAQAGPMSAAGASGIEQAALMAGSGENADPYLLHTGLS